MTVPNTTVRTSHAVSIRCGGINIGLIQRWNVRQTRGVAQVYELNAITSGNIYEQIPGNMGGQTIDVDRFDLYKIKMEQAWGINFSIQKLSDQSNPFDVQEKWKYPDGTVEIVAYSGCWFASLGRNLQSTGDRIVNVSASLNYTDVFYM